MVTRPSPIHGPYSLHIAFTPVAGSVGYLQLHNYAFKMAKSSPPDSTIVVVEQSKIPMSTWLVVTFLRHNQQPVEPNLQRHPYTIIGEVPYMAHG